MGEPFNINKRPKDDLSDDEMDQEVSISLRPPPKIRELKYITILGKGSFGSVCFMQDTAVS